MYIFRHSTSLFWDCCDTMMNLANRINCRWLITTGPPRRRSMPPAHRDVMMKNFWDVIYVFALQTSLLNTDTLPPNFDESLNKSWHIYIVRKWAEWSKYVIQNALFSTNYSHLGNIKCNVSGSLAIFCKKKLVFFSIRWNFTALKLC